MSEEVEQQEEEIIEEESNTEGSNLDISDEEFEKLSIPSICEAKEVSSEGENEVQEESSEDVETSETGTTNQEVDYKKVYEEVFKPFKANGKEMQVTSVDDVKQLMQMGANYNKKMAALKPNLKIVKMLENNGLLDEAKLSYLIDLEKKNPEAIRKLLKESNVDPLDINVSDELNYVPNNYQVNDKELELDSVLAEIKETPTFNTTLDVLGNKWDVNSRKVVLENPSLIKVINDHVGSGIYSTIVSEVDRLRVLGKLEGLSDIEAYKAVGDILNSKGAFNASSRQVNAPNSNKVTNRENPQLKQQKKAAASVGKSVKTVSNDFNPLSMSDEEFEKIASSKFI